MTQVIISKTDTKYDARHDILHVYLSPLELSIDDEDFPGIVVRRSIIDDHITGFVIMDYSKRNPELLRVVLPNYTFPRVTES